jgi:hypothetical protein
VWRQSFCGEQRAWPESFRLTTVQGGGLRAALASAVLEPEGFTVDPDASREAQLALVVDREGSGWRTSFADRHSEGSTFASLAELVRYPRPTRYT